MPDTPSRRGKRSSTAGIRCKCGSFDARVIRCVPGENHNTRRLECRECGERMTTVEKLVSGPQPKPGAIDSASALLSIGEILQSAGIVPGSPSRPESDPDNRK